MSFCNPGAIYEISMAETFPSGPQTGYVYTEGSYAFEELNTINVAPRRPDYQTAAVWVGFDMVDTVTRLHESFDLEAGQPLYMVVFRSRRKEKLSENDIDLLTWQDHLAHKEAAERYDADGKQALLHYFKGMADTDRYCVSWCIWTDANLAKEAVHAPEHMKAAALARRTYEGDKFGLQKYQLRLTEQGLHIKSAQGSMDDADVLLRYPG